MNIQEFVEHVKGQVGLMVEEKEELVPVAFVVSGEQVSIVGFEALNERVKQHWQALLTELLRQLNATAYIMVVEAWRSIKLSQDSPLMKRLQAGEISVSQLPLDDKEEVVQLLAVENAKSFQCWHAKIEHKADRRFIAGWEGLTGDMQVAGRMVVTKW